MDAMQVLADIEAELECKLEELCMDIRTGRIADEDEACAGCPVADLIHWLDSLLWELRRARKSLLREAK